jgi:serine/threonine protein kinase
MLGKSLGRYRIVQKLGEGGMGRVYLAHDDRLSRDVAIKVLPAGSLADEAARKRFHEEACALSQLSHPNIAMLHDFDTYDEIDFLVMEYVSGSTLSHLIEYGILPEKEIVRLAVQIAEACRAAHDAGIVHCDLKPANIMVSSNGLVKILDFGLARLTLPLLTTETSESATQTRKGGGTLPFRPVRPLVRDDFSPYARLSDREGFRINLLIVRYPRDCETPMGHDCGVLSFDR